MESNVKKKNEEFQSFSEIFKNKKKQTKPPAYPWQELALNIIKELSVPGFKKSSVFKICKELPENQVRAAFNDTKELCKTGNCWKYFFKVIDSIRKEKKEKK